jgi:WG containing repeat
MKYFTLLFFILFFTISQAQLCLVKREGKYGYINNKAEEVIPCIYDEASVMYDNRALVHVMKNAEAEGLYERYSCFFIDSTGKRLFKDSFAYAYTFNNNRAAVYNGKYWGFIDGTGKLVIPYKYNNVYYFNEGYAVVADAKWICHTIDTNGRIVSKKPLALSGELNQDYPPIVFDKHVIFYKKGKYDVAHLGMCNIYGKIKVPFIYNYTGELNGPKNDCHDGTWIAYTGSEGYGVFNTSGKLILPFTKKQYFESKKGLRYFGGNIGGVFYDKIEATGSFINNKNQSIISNKVYSYIDPNITEDYVSVATKDKKFGYCNIKGKEIIPCEYDDASQWVYNNQFCVVKDGKWGVVDTNNKVVLDFLYPKSKDYDDKLGYHNVSAGMAHYGFYELEQAANTKIITAKGKVVKEYYTLGPFNNGVAYYRKKDNEEGWIIINEGTIIELLKKPVEEYGVVAKPMNPSKKYYEFVTGFNAKWMYYIDANGDMHNALD